MIIFDAIFPTPDSRLPTPDSRLPIPFAISDIVGSIDLLLYSAQNYSPNLPETIRE
ncbi:MULTISPECIES: hypothetical protein [unclassified Moorena]|uniref:hypothetical protein n=1 Tax=unclassified Moorena TaxID=2683338 RepID=UPI0014013D9D|nr:MULTISPECIES: hypothetical protein [unclassified Moorena]NEO13726.1 hypothetical protein [Moorena sp. SIO3E8]NEP98391.1 hypothetical protein [Moorena sp. SIO3F7]